MEEHTKYYGMPRNELASVIRENFGIEKLLEGLPLTADDVAWFRSNHDVADLIRRSNLKPPPGQPYSDMRELDKLLGILSTISGTAMHSAEEFTLDKLLGCVLVTHDREKRLRDDLGVGRLLDCAELHKGAGRGLINRLGLHTLLGGLRVEAARYRSDLKLDGPPPTLSMVGFQLIMGAAILLEKCARLLEEKGDTHKVDWQLMLCASALHGLGSRLIRKDVSTREL